MRLSRPALLAALLLAGAALIAAPAGALATPAGCVHEARLPSGAVDPAGLCVSYGYGERPAGAPSTMPTTRNVVAYAEGRVAMPFDLYVRSDIAQRIAAGQERPRAAYVMLYGGAFICGSRADMASPAREAAKRGYIVAVPEYPLTGVLHAYGYYHPNAPYSQAAMTQRGANPCAAAHTWPATQAWQQTLLPRLRQRGLEPALQHGQWVVQAMIRTLKRDRTLGVAPERIFAIGASAGGALAIRLATGGNQDQLPSGGDPGDSTIAGALSMSGPACFPESPRISAAILLGAIRLSELPPCRVLLDADDPPFVMLQEPRGGADDPITPSALMWEGCRWLNDAGRRAGFGHRCIYEDRPISAGGYMADGSHADLGWWAWLRLLDTLALPTNFGQP